MSSTGEFRLKINGDERAVPGPLTVAELLRHLDVDGRQVGVECNKRLVPKSRFELTMLASGDELEIVTFAGGG